MAPANESGQRRFQVLVPAESPLLVAHLTREMDRLWRGAELWINGRLARKLAANRRRCGSGVRREVARD